jgi:threonine/homoserine/homoserine lactone efflux protein
MNQAAILDHQFVIAAYTVTWVLQLGYLAWLGLKWRAEKRNADRRTKHLS